jgi:hypothetical protein
MICFATPHMGAYALPMVSNYNVVRLAQPVVPVKYRKRQVAFIKRRKPTRMSADIFF